MIEPLIPANEAARLESLRSLCVLDTPADERFDRITRMAKRMFNVPIALVSLVDANRQWFKSCIGLEVSETPRNVSFCGHAILSPGAFVIPDATLDERFADNPLVTGGVVRFYAGYPLTLSDGSTIGTLCIISPEARTFDADDHQLLNDLGKMVEAEMEALKLATRCDLTGLSNRRGFLTNGSKVLSQPSKKPVTVAYFDMDGFKSINDNFGHGEGDRALRDFATILSTTFRSTDVVVGRLGGDEFAVVMSNCDENQAKTAIARLQVSITNHNSNVHRGYNLAFSVGLQTYDASEHDSFDALLAAADTIMFQNKRQRHAAKA